MEILIATRCSWRLEEVNHKMRNSQVISAKSKLDHGWSLNFQKRFSWKFLGNWISVCDKTNFHWHFQFSLHSSPTNNLTWYFCFAVSLSWWLFATTLFCFFTVCMWLSMMVFSFLLTSFSIFTSLFTISHAIVFSSFAVWIGLDDDYAFPDETYFRKEKRVMRES